MWQMHGLSSPINSVFPEFGGHYSRNELHIDRTVHPHVIKLGIYVHVYHSIYAVDVIYFQ